MNKREIKKTIIENVRRDEEDKKHKHECVCGWINKIYKINKHKVVCKNCGRYVFDSEEEKFKYRLKEKLISNSR